MTRIEWQKLEDAVAKMTDEERSRLADLLRKPTVPPSGNEDRSIGLFADEPELIDEIMASVYHARENHPLRVVG